MYRCTEVRPGQGWRGRVIRLLGFFTKTASHRLGFTEIQIEENHSLLSKFIRLCVSGQFDLVLFKENFKVTSTSIFGCYSKA